MKPTRSFPELAKRAILGIPLVFLISAIVLPLPAQEITSTDPGQYKQNSAAQFLELHGKDLIPDGSTYQTIPVDVKVFFDDGQGWKQGKIEIPGKGWGKGSLTVTAPLGVVPTVPSLKVKLTVKGVDSNVYAIPVFTLNADGPPKITSIRPQATAVGSGSYNFVIEVFANGSASGLLYFNQQMVPNYLCIAQSPDVVLYRFPAPDAIKNSPGGYPIQLKGGSRGDSNIVFWSLLEQLAITSAAPAILSAADFAPGAPSKAFQFGFSGSAPDSIDIRIDEAGSWSKISGPIVMGKQVFVGISLAAYKPAKKVEFRLKNAVSEAVKSYTIAPSLQAPQEKMATPAAVFVKLAITSAVPAVLSGVDVAPRAPAKAFQIGYSGSTPDIVEIRIDGMGSWLKIPDPLIIPNRVSFSLALGAYKPAKKVEIRLKNAVSEAVKTYAIISSLATQANKGTPVVIRKK